MKKYFDIKECLDHYIDAVKNEGQVTKAGIWQASELFEDEDMLVLRNLELCLKVPSSRQLLAKKTHCDLPWAEDHFQERISGKPTNPGETYKYWPYHTNLDKSEFKEKVFSHTYQERFWPKTANIQSIDVDGGHKNEGIRYGLGDLQDVINQLKENPLTRQAYLPIFFPEDTGAVHKQRVPCTLGYYFWVEGNRIYMNYIIRSCDVFRHFRNDVYLTGRLLQYVSDELGLLVGNMTMYIFNLHLFTNDIYALNKRETKLLRDENN